MDTRVWIPGRARPVRKNVLSLGSTRAALIAADINESEMSAPFVISTIDEDREKDIVEPRGCLEHLHEYERNPIVLFDHDQHQVVGTSKDKLGRFHFRVSNRDIRATCFFHDCLWKGIPIGVETFHLVRKGIFKGASISFLPVESRNRGYGEGSGVHYSEWRPTEWSICPLQSNQNALAEEFTDELRATLDRGEIKVKSFASHLRRTYLGPAPVWSPGATLHEPRLAFIKKSFTRHEASRHLLARGVKASGPTETDGEWIYSVESSGRLEGLIAKGIKYMKPEDEQTPVDETPAPAPEAPESEDGEFGEVPSGVENSAKYIVHFEHFLNDIEARESEANPKTKELFAKVHADVEQLMADLRSHTETEYPDHDIDGVADGYRPDTSEPEEETTQPVTKSLEGAISKRLNSESATALAVGATELANKATGLANANPHDEEHHELAYKLHRQASEIHEAAATSHKSEGNTTQAMHHTRLQVSHDRTASDHRRQESASTPKPVRPASRQKSLSKQHHKPLSACRDFLRDMPKTDKVHKSLHSSCLMHAKNLDGMMPEEDGDDDEGMNDEMVQKLLDRAEQVDKKLSDLDSLTAKAQEVGVLVR